MAWQIMGRKEQLAISKWADRMEDVGLLQKGNNII